MKYKCILPPVPIIDDDQRHRPAQTCANCRFSLLGTQGDPLKGICTRRPPALMQVTSGGDTAFVTAWPEVTGDDWCGEYRHSWGLAGDEPAREQRSART